MRKTISLFLIALIVFSLASCGKKQNVPYTQENETAVPAESAEDVARQLNINITLPDTARNVECAIVNDIIAQINFSFNSILYEYRASKLIYDQQLCKRTYNASKGVTLNIGDRAQLEVFDADEGGKAVLWYVEGTCYSLTCSKNISNDAITELCDLLVP